MHSPKFDCLADADTHYKLGPVSLNENENPGSWFSMRQSTHSVQGFALIEDRFLLFSIGYLFAMGGPEVARKCPESSPECPPWSQDGI